MKKTFIIVGFVLMILAILVFYKISVSCVSSSCGNQVYQPKYPGDIMFCSADCGGHKDYTTGYWIAGLGLLSFGLSRFKFKK